MKRRQVRLQGDKWQAVIVWDEPGAEDFAAPLDPTEAKTLDRYILFGPIGEGANLVRIEAHEIPWLINTLGQLYPVAGWAARPGHGTPL
jgi:hypothetical protein